MKCRKNLYDTLHELLESKKHILNKLIESNPIEQEFHKENAIELSETSALKLFWKGRDIDFIELVNSLYLSGLIQSNRFRLEKKEFLRAFETLFNIKIKFSDQKLNKIKNRKKVTIPFLEHLKQARVNDSES